MSATTKPTKLSKETEAFNRWAAEERTYRQLAWRDELAFRAGFKAREALTINRTGAKR